MKTKPSLTLSHPVLEKIFHGLHLRASLQSISANAQAEFILFAFRGCLPSRRFSTWGKSTTLVPATVDHIHMHCTLGIWDPKNERFFVAPGSTVPHRTQVEIAAAKKGRLKGKGTNQLEPGFYQDLTKGEHLQGKLNGHQALRQTAGRFYRRSPSGLPYNASSPLYFGNPYDNLHCGWNLKGIEPGFSSAGCLVVAGLPHCPRHEKKIPNQGPWKIFHNLLYACEQKSFPILLLPYENLDKIVRGTTTTQAKSHDAKRWEKNLIFGSSGEEVKALQQFLTAKGLYRGRIHGLLDARTYRAWRQKRIKKAFGIG